MLECAVDFELATGHSLATIRAEAFPWVEKAKRLAYYLRVLARTHVMKWNGIVVNCRQAMRTTIDAPAITPLGGPLMSGFARRLVWTDQRTTKVTAINVWKAKQHQTETSGRTDLAQRRSRKFANDWQLDMQGHKGGSLGQRTNQIHQLVKPRETDRAASQPCETRTAQGEKRKASRTKPQRSHPSHEGDGGLARCDPRWVKRRV